MFLMALFDEIIVMIFVLFSFFPVHYFLLGAGEEYNFCNQPTQHKYIEGTPRAQTSVKAAHQSPHIFVTPETFGP